MEIYQVKLVVLCAVIILIQLNKVQPHAQLVIVVTLVHQNLGLQNVYHVQQEHGELGVFALIVFQDQRGHKKDYNTANTAWEGCMQVYVVKLSVIFAHQENSHLIKQWDKPLVLLVQLMLLVLVMLIIVLIDHSKVIFL